MDRISANLRHAFSQVLALTSLDARQWHLNGRMTGQSLIDLNILPAWADYSGKNVRIGHYDDGIDLRLAEFFGRYDSARELPGNTPGSLDSGDGHGTATAGLIIANNDGIGMTGVAFGAVLTSFDIFKQNVDFIGAMNRMKNFDVTTHSWGFFNQGTGNPFDPFWQMVIHNPVEDAILTGRMGKGTINVFAAGNGRMDANDANLQGLNLPPGVITVGAVDENGQVSWYSTPGVNLLVTAPSSSLGLGIATTDMAGTAGYAAGDVVTNFGGTSASTPQVAGIVALMLEANPNLGWRDVQTILAYSARHVGSAIGAPLQGFESDPWAFNGARNWNGGGLHYSADYGFGLIDATAAVRLAETWRETSTSFNEFSLTSSISGSFALNDFVGYEMTFQITGALEVEHMRLDFPDLRHTAMEDLVIEVISPSGTVSHILTNKGGLSDFTGGWSFLSQEFRGETAQGLWTMRISDTISGETGSFSNVRLTLLGDSQPWNDTYIFTNEFAAFHTPSRAILSDMDGGYDTINASAVSANSSIDLRGLASSLAGKTLNIAANTIENAYSGDGNDQIVGNILNNILDGGRGNDSLFGREGEDTLWGGQGGDRLFGGAGADRLHGGTGNDSLFGEAGDDWLHDGAGTDALWGGTGADVFQLGNDTLRDVVVDFVRGEDRIALTRLEFGGVIADGTLDAGDFSNVANVWTLRNVTGFVFSQSDSSLYFDASASDPFRPLLVAQLTNIASLALSDFLVV